MDGVSKEYGKRFRVKLQPSRMQITHSPVGLPGFLHGALPLVLGTHGEDLLEPHFLLPLDLLLPQPLLLRLFPLVLSLPPLVLRVDLSLPQLLQRATASGARGRALHPAETSLRLVVLGISIERRAGRLYPLDVRIRSETLGSPAYAPQVGSTVAEIPVARAVADVRIRAELFQLEILGRGGFRYDQTLAHVEISQIGLEIGRSLTGETA